MLFFVFPHDFTSASVSVAKTINFHFEFIWSAASPQHRWPMISVVQNVVYKLIKCNFHSQHAAQRLLVKLLVFRYKYKPHTIKEAQWQYSTYFTFKTALKTSDKIPVTDVEATLPLSTYNTCSCKLFNTQLCLFLPYCCCIFCSFTIIVLSCFWFCFATYFTICL